jgi:hypothetical protein
MKRTTSKIFDLLPSVQRREESLAPAALVPAIPVRLGAEDGLPTYAIIDTGAKISSASKHLLSSVPNTSPSVPMSVRMGGGKTLATHLVKTELVLCDTQFSPWIRLHEVPFVLGDPSADGVDLVLGYDACLALLRLTLDYPRRRLHISGSIKLLATRQEAQTLPVPSRIIEAERLFAMGSYEAAVALAFAGIEEVFVELTRDIPVGANWSDHLRNWSKKHLDKRRQRLLQELTATRNRAVHPTARERVSATEARAALKSAHDLVSWLHSEFSVKRGTQGSSS